jgi:phospholipid/cholesterol/gamma-HCH transport system substrate-binding protein
VTRTGWKLMLRRQLGNVVVLIALTLVGIGAGVYIVDHQNASFPSWVPLIGDDPYVVHAELQTAQGVIPGQGQLVEVAGVIVGRVASVHLDDGRAVLDIHLERGQAKLYRNASILMRPRTLLKDMILQVTPGTPAAGLLRGGDRIPVSSTLPDVNLDELLASLDRDTRDALVALVQGAGQGLRGQGDRLGSVFRRLNPTMQSLRSINDELMKRRTAIRRVVTNFSLISTTLARHRSDLTRFVAGSNQVFGALAAEQAGVRSALRGLPPTLTQVNATTRALTPVAGHLGSASRKLLPGARSLGGGARALDGMFTATRPALEHQLRPLARGAVAPLRDVRRAVDGMSGTSSAARGGTHQLNAILNDLAHDPHGAGSASYLFWAAWSAHQVNSVLSSQDAVGPFAHTMTVMTCSSLGLLPGFVRSDPALALAVSLANFPTQEQVCR